MLHGFTAWLFMRTFEWGTISLGLHGYELMTGIPFGPDVSPYLYIFAYVFMFPFGIASFLILSFMGMIGYIERNAVVKMNPLMVLVVSSYFIFTNYDGIDLQSLSFMAGYYIVSFISVRVFVVSFGLKAGIPMGTRKKRKPYIKKNAKKAN